MCDQSNKISFITIVIVFIFFLPHHIFSQNLPTINITIEKGLPSNSAQDIFKDSRGYLWIGTEAGLCKYDGIDFKTYTTADGLPGNRIWSITEDEKGDLWLACFGNGISRFDGRTFHNYSTADGLVNNNVRKVVYSNKSKGLMIGTVFGFSYFRDSTFTSFCDSSVSDRELFQVTDFIDCDSTVYILTYRDSERFISFNPYTKVFSYLPKNHRYHTRSAYSTMAFISSENDTIIADYVKGVKIIGQDTIRFIDDLAQVNDITQDKNGNLWITSWNDGNIPDINGTGGVYRVTGYKASYFSSLLGINTQLCRCLYYDENENLLWVGTDDKGIFLYPISGIEYTYASNLNPSFPEIHDIMMDSKNKLWITAGDKLLLRSNDGTERSFEGSGDFHNMSNNLTSFDKLFEDNSGNIWVKTNLGILKLSENYKPRLLFNEMLNSTSFFIDRDSSISILLEFELLNFHNRSTKSYRLRKNSTFAYLSDFLQQGNIFWIYNNTDGIMRYESGVLKKFDYLEGKMDLSFSSLDADRAGNLIAGTNSGKIYILRTNNDSLNIVGQLSQKDGIQGMDIKWILADNSDRLWFATNRGLHLVLLNRLYDEGEKRISYFNFENGFFDRKTHKAIAGPDKKITVISDAFLTTFTPEELLESVKKKTILTIKKIEVNFNEYDLSPYTTIDTWTGMPDGELVLPYDKNTLIFTFHLLQYAEAGKARYCYKLNGIQKNWTDFSDENKAVFTGLKPGKYNLSFKGRLLSSPDTVIESEFLFRILQPWYRRLWFLAFITFLLLATTSFLIRYRINQIRKEAEINRTLESLKLKVLKSQMNPHFIFNAFNSIQKYILNKDSKSALNYMSDFASLIRKTLDNSTMEKISLTDEISYLKSYIELEERRIPNLSYRISVDDNVDTDGFFIPPMLIQPVVENSILHGIRHLQGPGMVTICFRLSSGTGRLICTVEDNGIGRKNSQELYRSQEKSYSSLGSKIYRQRAAMYGVITEISDLTIQGSPSGTLVEFRF